MESSESVVGLCDDEGACVERGEGLCMLNRVFGERRYKKPSVGFLLFTGSEGSGLSPSSSYFWGGI